MSHVTVPSLAVALMHNRSILEELVSQTDSPYILSLKVCVWHRRLDAYAIPCSSPPSSACRPSTDSSEQGLGSVRAGSAPPRELSNSQLTFSG
jgi:hypothetical protein